jgi:hypothetical protein
MTLFDYLKWRGDLTFEASQFNSVDALILCQLSYLNFNSIVQPDFKVRTALNTAAAVFAGDGFEQRRNLGLLINPLTVELLFEAAKTKRFANLELSAFRDSYDKTEEEQFSAVTFLNRVKDNSFAFCAFRGTDDTIIGWKEDCNLAFKECVKAQKDALCYLEEACSAFKKASVICGGHSKGGNLAVFAGAKLPLKYQKKLDLVYNFDGPGFLKETLESEDFKRIENKLNSYFPQESVVGMLFEHFPEFKVIKSTEKNMMQHDPLSWQTEALDFELCPELSKLSIFFNGVFNEWFVRLTKVQREELVEVIFGALESTKARTNSELAENWGRSGLQVLKGMLSLDKELRESALESAREFVKLAGRNLPELLKK